MRNVPTTMALLTLAALGLTVSPSLAVTRTVPSDTSQEAFADNCEAQGGYLIEGQTASGCDLPSGTQVVCQFDEQSDGTQNTLCEIDGRPPAEGLLADLLGGVLPNRMGAPVPESLTSSGGGSESSSNAVGGSSSGGGRGPSAGGAVGGSGSIVGGLGPIVK